jgi:transcriptional regulator GlxA family with amidase domain
MLVCAGVDGCYYRDRRTFAWLRTLARHGTILGGIGTAAYLLARAGVLDGHRCTIHWEDLESFTQEFPELEVTSGLFEIDGARMTCAGGTAALDMVLSLIAARHGHHLAGAIAEQFIQHQVRAGGDHQRMNLQSRMGVSDARLLAAIAAMESNVEEPLSLESLCAASGVSIRHLQRLFHTQLGQSPLDFYRALRLRQARQMLLHGSVSILDVAVATGFVSSSHFTRRYRELFGLTPREERRRQIEARRGLDRRQR